MGNTSENQSLEDIGKKANQQSPSSFINSSIINLGNSTIIGLNNHDPENDYKKINQIGKGQFGEVYEVKNRITDIVRAMKVIKKHSSKDESELVNEVKILTSMDHPCIVKIFEFYSNNESYSIIMEHCKEGSLLKELNKSGPFNEAYTAYIMYQLFFAINYYNGMHIIHRNLKPVNLLIYNKNKETKYPNIKIGDFGMSKIVGDQEIQNKIVGTLFYNAPEVLEKNYNEKSDLWSCGVIMYLLLTGKVPFDADTPVSVALKHMQEMPQEPIELNPNIPTSINKIIMKALQKDTNLRYQSATEMLEDLNMCLKNPEGDFVEELEYDETAKTQVINTSRLQEEANKDKKSNGKKENKLKRFIKNHKALSIFIGLILLFAVSLGGTMGVLSLTNPPEVEMPKVIGMTKDEAQKAIEDAEEDEARKEAKHDLAVQMLAAAKMIFSRDEYNIFKLYFQSGFTFRQIGELFGTSGEAVSYRYNVLCGRLFGMFKHTLNTL